MFWIRWSDKSTYNLLFKKDCKMEFFKSLPYVGAIVLLVVSLAIALGHNLDKPTPVRENGEITAFDTPFGRVKKNDPRFAELVKSYQSE